MFDSFGKYIYSSFELKKTQISLIEDVHVEAAFVPGSQLFDPEVWVSTIDCNFTVSKAHHHKPAIVHLNIVKDKILFFKLITLIKDM